MAAADQNHYLGSGQLGRGYCCHLNQGPHKTLNGLINPGVHQLLFFSGLENLRINLMNNSHFGGKTDHNTGQFDH